MKREMMEKVIAFDMDGTIADLYNVNNWLAQLRKEKVNPYRDAEPMYDMEELGNVLRKLKTLGWKIIVISWGAMNGTRKYTEKVKIAKREWLRKYNFPADKIHVVKYGTTKHSCCKYAKSGILIDDNEKVRKSWKLGDTINPDNTLIQKLEALIA